MPTFSINSPASQTAAQGEFDNFKFWNLDNRSSLDTEQARAFADQAAQYIAGQQWNDALDALTRAIELDPANPRHYIDRAFVHDAGFGRMSEALADATKAVELAPALYDAWAERGAIYMHMGECASRIADHNRAIQLDPQRFEGYVHRADALRCQGALDEAIADYDHALTIEPASAWAVWNRGSIYEQTGDLDAALNDYTRAIQLSPNDPWASPDYYFSRAGIYRAQGQHMQALADCEAILRLVSDDPLGFYCRGLSETALGQTGEARVDFEKATTLPPLSAWEAWVTEAARTELSKLPQ
jgi:tetratricopeptide (TPR) repeat protein